MKFVSQDHPDFFKGMPPVLYKYRNWEIDFHRRLLFDNEIYFSSMDDLNDPYEGAILFRYHPDELTEENVKKKHELLIRGRFPAITQEEIKKDWESDDFVGKLKDKNHILGINKQYREQNNSVWGVYSLTQTNRNYLLWSYYANSHKGFCVGLDSKKLAIQLQCSFIEVEYEVSPPYIGLFDDVITVSRKLLSTKAEFWKHEEEIRLRKGNAVNTKFHVPNDCILEVIFGCKMPKETRFEIAKAISEKNKNVKMFEAKLDVEEFKLDIVEWHLL